MFDIKDLKSWANRHDVETKSVTSVTGFFGNSLLEIVNEIRRYNRGEKDCLHMLYQISDNDYRCFGYATYFADTGAFAGTNNFAFFLPLNAVKKDEPEKKYRPFETIEEFVKTIGDIGTIITYREKKEPSQEMRGIFTGYMWDRACRGWILGLGATLYRLENLFELAEYKYKNEWQPFGVEE